jgi:GTPase SAR1 family protein
LAKATNLEELYQIFDHKKYVKNVREESYDKDYIGEEFYIDIYNAEIKRLRVDLRLNQNQNRKFYIAGQSGSGKTSALNFLVNEKIESKYSVKFIRGRDLFQFHDVDIIDVLLMIGYELIKDDGELKEQFFGSLERVRKTKLDSYQEINERDEKIEKSGEVTARAKLSTGFLPMLKFDLGMFAKYKSDKTIKTTVREMFALNRQELVDEVNKIIQKYEERVNKRLLLIIDDLEKMRDLAQIEELFVDNGELFDKLKCVKVLTIPIYLTTKHSMFDEDVFKYSFRIDKSPFSDENSIDEKPEENRAKLIDLIFQRVDKTADLISDEVIEEAIKFSGGNIRLLIQLIQRITVHALTLDEDATQLTIENFDDGLSDLRNTYATSIMDRVETLHYILENNQLTEKEEEKLDKFKASLLDNMVFAYFNGDPWYRVNPIIESTVKKYFEQANRVERG